MLYSSSVTLRPSSHSAAGTIFGLRVMSMADVERIRTCLFLLRDQAQKKYNPCSYLIDVNTASVSSGAAALTKHSFCMPSMPNWL